MTPRGGRKAQGGAKNTGGASKAPGGANGHRRRQVVARVFAEESVCWLCGEAVDMGLRGVYVVNPKTGKRALHPRAPVVDEIVPRSRGGSPYERSNCRLAHNRCNRYRSDRTDIEAVQAELRGLAGPKPKPTASQRWGACPSRSPTEASAAQSQNTPESEKQP